MRSIKALMLLTIAFTVFAFSSCKKDKETLATSTISVDIDGVATVFTTNTLALTGSVNDVEFTNVQGTDKNGNMITVSMNGTVTAGKTYLSTASEFTDRPTLSFSTPNDEDTYFNDEASVQSITVTSISANRIEGTFAGKVNTSAFGNGAVKFKSFTNGRFKVAIVK